MCANMIIAKQRPQQYTVLSAHPLLQPKVMWDGIYIYMYIYSIHPPFTTELQVGDKFFTC